MRTETRTRRRLLVKTAEAAEALDVSRWTIRRWIGRGLLEGFNLDGRGVSHVSVNSIRRLVNSRAAPGVRPVQMSGI